jgi:hypothetical protein
MSVSEFVALSEVALGGGATAYSYADLDYVTSNISIAFADATVQDFATDHLDFPQVDISSTPLPSSILLFGSGIAGYCALRRWRRNSSNARHA